MSRIVNGNRISLEGNPFIIRFKTFNIGTEDTDFNILFRR